MEQATEVLDVLRVRRLEVVGADDRIRVFIGVVGDEHGEATVVSMFAPHDVERLTLSCDAEAAALEFVEGGTAVGSLSVYGWKGEGE